MALAVWSAYEQADEANTAFWISLSKLASAARSGAPSADPSYQDVLDVMYQRRASGRAADETLFEAINTELAWREPAHRVGVFRLAKALPRALAKRSVT